MAEIGYAGNFNPNEVSTVAVGVGNHGPMRDLPAHTTKRPLDRQPKGSKPTGPPFLKVQRKHR